MSADFWAGYAAGLAALWFFYVRPLHRNMGADSLAAFRLGFRQGRESAGKDVTP